MDSTYRGWGITYRANRPVTGVYIAERQGVTMCAANRVAIERMIDQRFVDDLISDAAKAEEMFGDDVLEEFARKRNSK